MCPPSLQVDSEGSRKELVVSERQAQLTDAVQQFKPGQVVRGQVLRLEDYGALVAIYNSSGKASGVQGLLHKSEMSWDLVWTVDEVVQTGEWACMGRGGGVCGPSRISESAEHGYGCMTGCGCAL